MAMDEIQDLTLFRTMLRQEREELLSRQFEDSEDGRIDHIWLAAEIAHFRVVVLPFVDKQMKLESEILSALGANDVPVYFSRNSRRFHNDIAFRGLGGSWRPFLRGRKVEVHESRQERNQSACKRIKTNGLVQFDYAEMITYEGRAVIAQDWVVGFFAEVCRAVEALAACHPSLLPAAVRVGFRFSGDMRVAFGRGGHERLHALSHDIAYPPDFLIETVDDLDRFFEEVQVDFASLAGVSVEDVYLRREPPTEAA